MKKLGKDQYREVKPRQFLPDEPGWKTYWYCRADLNEGAINSMSVQIRGGDEEFALFLMELGMSNPDRYQYWACDQ